jgi:hypothetical protein
VAVSEQVEVSGLVKAQLIELNEDFSDEEAGGQKVVVQFNPETLKMSFANQIDTPKTGDQANGTSARQFVGSGTTKLSLQLWFDVSALKDNSVDDVRRLTQQVIFFMRAKASKKDKNKVTPPGVRFLWGSFIFDGLVDSLEESLEFFSPQGRPLRASMSLALSQQKISEARFADTAKAPARGGTGAAGGAAATQGTAPLSAAKEGESLANMAAKQGTADWQSIAQGNGVEDPLRMKPGQLIDMAARATGGLPAL